MRARRSSDGGDRPSRSQAGAVDFSGILPRALLKDLDHGILLNYFCMEILYSAKI